MMRRLVILLVLLSTATAFAIDTEDAFEDPVMQERYRALIHSIRCMKCQNQSIADSPIAVAADLRRQVRDMMADGQSDREISSYLASRYGDFILYRPPLKPSTYVLWAGPAIFLALGGLIFVRTVRTRMQQPLDEDLSE